MSPKKQLTDTERRYKKIARILALICGLLFFIHFLLISLFYSWSDWTSMLMFALLFIVPAYLANAGMVFTGGGAPIDAGKMWRDGRRILGDHKTWNGLLKGPLYVGIPISFGIFVLFLILWQFIGPAFQAAINADLYNLYDNISYYEYYFVGGPYPWHILSLTIRITLCAYSAGIGDLVGSFLKRRVNIPSGMPFWIIDQLDFAVIAILLLIIPALLFPSLFLVPDIHIILFLLILTPSVSIIGNNVGYLLGIKDVPW